MEPALEERIRAGYAAFVAGDLDAAMEDFAPDVSLVNPDYALEDGVRDGRDELRKSLETLHDQFEFESIDIQEMVEGPEVVVLMLAVRAHGRHSGVPLRQTFAHVWHTRGDQALRFEWFVTREEALAAAGLA